MNMATTAPKTKIQDIKTAAPDGKAKLRDYVGRIEKLTEERGEITADIRGIFKQAKDNGLDKKCIKEVLRFRRMDRELRELFRDTVDEYMTQLDMFSPVN